MSVVKFVVSDTIEEKILQEIHGEFGSSGRASAMDAATSSTTENQEIDMEVEDETGKNQSEVAQKSLTAEMIVSLLS